MNIFELIFFLAIAWALAFVGAAATLWIPASPAVASTIPILGAAALYDRALGIIQRQPCNAATAVLAAWFVGIALASIVTAASATTAPGVPARLVAAALLATIAALGAHLVTVTIIFQRFICPNAYRTAPQTD